MSAKRRKLRRREFLKVLGSGVGGLFLAGCSRWPLSAFRPVEVGNPLESYPDRDWEKVYRNAYRYDSTFSFVCAPNDTHNCRMTAFVRNGVVVRTEQSYESGRVSDLEGNRATEHWNPRGCAKGFTIHRRVYGPYRLKHPLVRRGWREWAEAGFPSLSDAPELRRKYRFDARGTDVLERLSWDQAYGYLARAAEACARTYSGEQGAERLRRDGYEPEMIEACGGAGTRTMKLRGGMGLLGVLGKYGMYRWANMLALLDQKVRGVPPEEARGGRIWSNYTWHGDQAPGHPFVHGVQASDGDFNDLRRTRLHIQCGKNLVENKMSESHWFIEMMERGGKIVVITPEYSPASTKADYWIRVRPGCTDTALFLGITRLMMDRDWVDVEFVRRFTDFPLLLRTDTLERLRARDVFRDYRPGLDPGGPSFTRQHLKPEQYEKIGDFVVFDEVTGSLKPLTRDDVGRRLEAKGLRPALSWRGKVRLVSGQTVSVMTIWEAYRDHLKDYDLGTVSEITGAESSLIERLARDIWDTAKSGGGVALHIGEGINHWFHATLANRAQFLPLMLVGAVGKPGSGCFTWAGNYKAAIFQADPAVGPGFLGWIAEDPFAPLLDPKADGKDVPVRKTTKDEEPAYWNHGDRPLVVHTPKYGRRCFTGATHMPTPTKFLWFNNVNLFNNAKHAYDMLFNVNPKIDCIVAQDVEMTASCEYADLVLPANTWMEFQTWEVTVSCSNPFLQVWKGGIPPVHDTRDDLRILAEAAERLGREVGDDRFAAYWKFVLENPAEGSRVYLQRLFDGSTTTRGYRLDDVLAGKYGEPGVALLMFRTYPRIPFFEQVHDDEPFWTDTGRLNSYCDIPDAVQFGENFVVHREGPEATPYLPNVIVSSHRLVRPDDFGIPLSAMHWDERTIRNVKMPWSRVKETRNPLWEQGFRFFLLTPKTRHRVHSQWSLVDWHQIWDSSFGDPYRRDQRSPGVGEPQLHLNPDDARELGIANGDYVYVDANPEDRPFRGWRGSPERAKVARLKVRALYNPAYPRGVVMVKHAPFMATEKTVRAHETRPDGRAQSPDTGYQANFRYGSHQALTRNWLMPMHQTDTLFHKAKVKMGFLFGGEADNHAVNTVPKETLVRLVRAEPGGRRGRGVWDAATTGLSPRREDTLGRAYLEGSWTRVEGGSA